jgi:MATE family multidrug resistance protein
MGTVGARFARRGAAPADPSESLVSAVDRRRLWALAAPNLVSMGSFTSLAVVNAAWVGQLGTAELGAIGVATTWVYLVVSFPLGLLRAVRTPVANRVGAGDPAGAAAFTWQAVWLALGLGLAVLPASLAGRALFPLLGASDAVVDAASAYASVRLLGAPLHFLIAALGAGFQGRGDSWTPMVANLLANVVNAALDPILVFGAGPVPALGTAGAALGVDVGLAVALATLAWRAREVLGASAPALDGARLREVWRVGGPAAVQLLLDVGSFVGFQALLAGSGDAVLAANVIVARIVMASFLPAQALGDAVAVLVGQARGAGRPRDALRAAQLAARDVVTFTAGVGAAFLLVPGLLVAPFGASDEVLALVRPVLVLWAVAQIVDGLAQVQFGALTGAGDTRYVLAVTTFGAWFVKLPIAAALVWGADGGVVGAWAGLAAECGWQVATTGARLRGVGWLVRDRRRAAGGAPVGG